MFKRSVAVLGLCLALLACASPEGVPRGASVAFNPTTYSGQTWSWQRRTAHGCADFTTSDGAPSVRLSVDPARCGGRHRTFVGCDWCGPGVMYVGGGYVFFQNYWPWTSRDFTDGVIFDERGMGVGVRVCPHTLAPEQIEAIRVVAREALAQATTDQERNAVQRVDQILAATNGAALASGQHGCTPGVATPE